MANIFSEEELEWLNLEVTNETIGIMASKKVHLYVLKEDENAFVSNYDIVENKLLENNMWAIFRNVEGRTNQLYFTKEMLQSNDNPMKWLLQMLVLYQKITYKR